MSVLPEKKEILKVYAEGIAMYPSVHTPKKGYTEEDLPKYSIDLIVDAKTSAHLKSQGIAQAMLKLGGVREYPEHPGKAVYRFTRKSVKKDGEINTPPEVVDSLTHKIPKTTLIGNGSRVKVSVSPWKFGNKSGTTLIGVQVLDLVPYESSGLSAGFEKATGFVVEQLTTTDQLATESFSANQSPFDE